MLRRIRKLLTRGRKARRRQVCGKTITNKQGEVFTCAVIGPHREHRCPDPSGGLIDIAWMDTEE